MNRKLKKLLALAALGFPFLSLELSAESLEWSLDSCISYARNNNIQVLQSALTAESAQEDLKEAKAALFPSLTFSSGQNLNFDKDTDGGVYTGSYTLSAAMTLYNGGKNLKNIRQQNLALESSRYNYLYTANSVELSIIKAYYQVLYSRESVLTNQEIVETSKKQLERSLELFKVGAINKVELSQIQSQQKSDEYQLLLAQTAESENLLNLKQLLQINANTDFSVEIPDMTKEETLAPIPARSEIEQMALSTLPELKAASAQIKIAQLTTEMAKAERLPTVSLNGSVSTGHNSVAENGWGAQMNDNLSESIGLNISVPIFNNRSTRSKIQRARIAQINSQLSYDNSQLEIQNTIASLHLDAVSSQSRYQAALAQVDAAQQSYDLVEQKYNLGMQNTVDLLVEKDNLLSALQEKIQAKYTALLDLRLIEFYMNPKSENIQ